MNKLKPILAVLALLSVSACSPDTPYNPELVTDACKKLESAAPETFQFKEIQDLCILVTSPTTTTTTKPSTTTTQATTTLPPQTTTTVTTSTTAPTTTTVPGSIQPNGPTRALRLAWNDEFNGNSLDLNKWRPNWLGGSDTAVTPPVNSYELSCYDPRNVRVADGELHLTATNTVPANCRTRSGPAQYSSGMVQSDGHYRYTTGYLEFRAFLPGTSGRPGNWPALWSNGTSWPRDGEIDVMEVLGGEPRWHYHATNTDIGSGFNLISPKTGWHTFGVLREAGRLTFYYDGKNVGTVTQNVVSSSHYIIINHALSSQISPPVRVPSTLRVDYVRHFALA